MNITELDEWQGITADMVREWLKRTGWELRTDEWGEKRWFNGNGRSIADKRVLVTDGFRWIASQSVQTVQALLREINQRMRKGMPSEAAREAHPGGLWLATPDFACIGAHVPVVVTFDGDGFGVWHPEGFALPDSTPKHAHLWHFWPCDEHGNKVRWPTDSEGKML